MLKIKNKIDLKELEKFEFDDVDKNPDKEDEYTTIWGDFDYEFRNTYAKWECWGRRGQQYYILVDKNTRIIFVYATKPDGDGCKGKLDNTLYDLIQAGLVEKVEE